jgi:hypothetical protein
VLDDAISIYFRGCHARRCFCRPVVCVWGPRPRRPAACSRCERDEPASRVGAERHRTPDILLEQIRPHLRGRRSPSIVLFGIAAVRAARSGAIGSRSTPGPSHQWNGGGRGPQWGPNGRPFGWAPYGWRGGPTYWVWGPSGGAFDYPSPTGEAQWAGGVIRRPKRRRRLRGRAGYIGLDLHIDLDR